MRELTMEDASVTLNGHGEGNFKQPDTAQKQHVFTTKVFVQMGQKDVENDEPFLKDAISIVQKDVVNGKVIGEESVNKSWKLISEDEVVVVSKTSTAFHSELLLEQEGPGGETKETDGSTVDSLLLNIETVIDDGLLDGTHEPANDKREVLDEDAPVVIEKSPVSPNMEIAIEGEDPSDEDWKNARKNDEIGEEVTEDEVAVVEKTPVASSLESDILIENPDDGGKEDDTTTVDSLLANIESVIDQSPLERAQEPANKNIAEVIEELAPVVEKKSFSLDVVHLMKETDEGSENGEHVTKQRQSFVEDEVVMVKKTVVVCKVESEILVENPDDEGKHADNATVQSLLNNIESVIDDELPERPQELEDAKKSDALEEDYPVVVKKKPISVNVERAIDFDVKEDEQDVDPVVETEVVVVEKETRAILESEILVDNEEAKKGDSATVEDLLVTVEKVIDAEPCKRTHESLQEKGKPLAEDSPIVIDKRPAPFDMDQMMEQDEETKEQEKKDPVCETAPIVVEKTAVIVESEMLVDNEEIEEDDSTPVETLLVNIESVVDHTLLETAKEPSEDVVEALEEDSPVVIEKRPALFYIEHPLDEDHEKKDVDEREPVAEAELVVVEKTPVALESVMLVDNEQSEEDDSTPVEILLVNIESVVDHTLLKAAKEPSEDVVEALEEDSPVVIEKRPASFCIEHPLDENHEKKDEDEREPVSEIEVVVLEKTPVALESDMLVDNEENKEEDSTPVETLLVNIESVVDHTLLKDAKEPSKDVVEALEEDSPVVIEKKPASFYIEHPLDENHVKKDEDEREPVSEIEVVVVEKTPVALESVMLVDNEQSEEDESTTVETLLVNIESVVDYTLLKDTKEPSEDVAEALEEDSPVVIEKRPASFYMEHPLDEVLEKKDVDEREPVSEAELVVVEKTPVALESVMLVDNEQSEEDDSTPVEILLVNIESVVDHTLLKAAKEPSEDVVEALEEDSPVVIEKKPASLHIEHPLDEDLEKKDEDEREPVSGFEVVVVEKPPVALESDMLVDNEETKEKDSASVETLLVENEETKEDDSTPVETLLVNIESVVDHTLLEAVKIPSEVVVEAIEEDSPVVIEKRPASLHIEHPFDEDLEKKDVDEREPVAEAELVVVEKTPVALDSDMLVDNEETKEKDSASVETLLENIKSVIDNTTPDQTEEPASAIKPDVLEEDAPIVIEKRPILLHMEEMPDEMNGEGDPKAPVTEGELFVVNKTPAIVELGILVEKEGTEGVEDDNPTVESLLVNVESVIDYQLPKEGRERADEMKTEALQEDEPVVIEKSPVSLHVNQLLDQDDNQKEHDNSETVEGEHELPKSRELVSEAKLVVINKTPASLESELLIELESPEKDHATVESLLVNIESVIDDTSPEQPKVEDLTQPSESKEPIEETVPRAVEKRKRDSSEMEELFVAQNPEESTEKEGRSQDESSNLVDEVVINVVEKKRVCHEQPSETLENQSSVSEESTSVIVLDIPLVEKTEVVKDSVQETVPPAMERKAAESEEELLQRTDEDEPTEPECRETAILDDLEGETLKSTSYTKLFDKDEGSDDELLRQVLSRKRLSAPEILPEKEKDGSAPLAPSESGILDSKEHVPTAHLSHTREAIPMSALPKVDNSEKVKDAEEQAAKGLLEADDEDQIDGKRNRLGKKGLASPQCKCCSLM